MKNRTCKKGIRFSAVCVVFAYMLLHGFACKAQDLLTIKSINLKTTDSVLVYKPASYNSKSKYPTVFMLHGHSGNFRSWAKLTDLQALSNEYGFILVCPDGLKKSWYLNSPNRDSVQYEDFFFKELLPKINKNYQADQTKLFITGYSMGGYGAMYYFIKYPDVFLSAGSTSGVLNLRHSGFKKTTLAYLLGSYAEDNKLFDEYSPVNQLAAIKDTKKTLIFDCGTEDYLYKANNQFRQNLDGLKIKATYTTQPGAHTGGYWTKSIAGHFRFFAELAREEKETIK
jgi:putative tributyrin esterase